MNILESIKQKKVEEVAFLKSICSIKSLEKSGFFESKTISIKQSILFSKTGGIISEFKRKSPAKGNINLDANVISITTGYVDAEVAALSVLTDVTFFGAKPDDFFLARENNKIPILRKDFIIDEYQIIQSKTLGADVILLIAKILTHQQMHNYTNLAHQLGMEVFLETQNETEILSVLDIDFDLIGINNRNLNSFEVSIENSIKLAKLLPESSIKIAESGIQSVETIKLLKQNGFNGFLIGEYFMKEQNPAEKCKELIQQLL
ncbi:indole-3-glycerol-phosphate synthase [Flavobacterium sp.]|uniref:indole-3-glycerol phosphate synthase TrpC n=1 Tax=Flavobacterium sp. TaxID=239 RepID=UPI0037513F7F